MKPPLALLLFALLTGACTERSPGPAEELRTTVDTVGSVLEVRSAGVAPEWHLEPVLRLGTVEGGPEEFGRIRSLAADADGNVYVAENFAQEIRVFTPDGRPLRTIGGRGEGPGEFGEVYSLAWLGEDLVVMDPGNARLAIFSREGEWLGSIRHFPITGPPSRIRLHPLGSEGFYAPIVDLARPGLPLARLTTAGSGDTIPAPRPPADTGPTAVVCHRPDGAITSIAVPESPSVVYGFPPSGGIVAASWTDAYRVHFVGAGGDTLRVVSREGERVAFPDSLWEEGMRPFQELREAFPGARCEPSAPERPRFRAALRHLLFDEGGRLWVEAAAASGFRWEVFDAEGRLVGAAPAPPRVPGIPPYVRDGRLYQVEVDDLDVQFVAVYRLVERR